MRSFKGHISEASTLGSLCIMPVDDLSRYLDELAGVYLGAYQELGEYAYSRAKDVRHYMKWLYRRAPGGFFLAREGDELIGFIVADAQWFKEGEKHIGEIHEVVVKKDARGRGVGRILIEKALAYFREEGLKKVGLWVGEKNSSAREFYKRLHFQESGRMGRWVRMERSLE